MLLDQIMLVYKLITNSLITKLLLKVIKTPLLETLLVSEVSTQVIHHITDHNADLSRD